MVAWLSFRYAKARGSLERWRKREKVRRVCQGDGKERRDFLKKKGYRSVENTVTIVGRRRGETGERWQEMAERRTEKDQKENSPE
jgi:hypothetical protein